MHIHTPAVTFADLPFGEQFVLWAMRLWTRGQHHGTLDHATLRNGFKLAGAPAAHGDLDGLMTIITTAATGAIDIRGPQCRDISADEHHLMSVIAGFQRTGAAGSDLFDRRLPPTAKRLGMERAKELANTLAKAGLNIRPRRPARPATKNCPPAARPIPGAPTFH